jgi:hypothetical protein
MIQISHILVLSQADYLQRQVDTELTGRRFWRLKAR